MNNQPCMVRPTPIDLNPDELHYYPFIISLDRCDGNCNTDENPLGRICVPNKMEEGNFKIFKSKTLVKHILCEYRCVFDGRKGNLKQKWNNDKCRCECEKSIKHRVCEDYSWNLSISACKCNNDCEIDGYLKVLLIIYNPGQNI